MGGIRNNLLEISRLIFIILVLSIIFIGLSKQFSIMHENREREIRELFSEDYVTKITVSRYIIVKPNNDKYEITYRNGMTIKKL